MKSLSLTMIVLCLAACSSPQKKIDVADTAKQDTLKAKNSKPPVISSYCFLHREGKDSTRVEFTVVNNYVQGLMNWFPYEKDGRHGIIEGTLKNDTLHAVWSYDQEHTKDTLKVEFLLKSPTDLRQKPLIANMKNGRQQTDQNAGYIIRYKTEQQIAFIVAINKTFCHKSLAEPMPVQYQRLRLNHAGAGQCPLRIPG